ncbi:LemA family protein [bacterium]|nr:LemA family protein [bacterium]
MKKQWAWIVLGVLVVGLLGWGVTLANQLARMSEGVNASWAQVDNQLKRRADLVPNLVATVKGYAAHERGVFESIASARAQLAGAKSVDQKANASARFESALSRLLVVVEQYPNLKADAQFARLMDELAGSENRLSVERMRYNDTVKAYNLVVITFPGSLVARLAGYQKHAYFEVSTADRERPSVSF